MSVSGVANLRQYGDLVTLILRHKLPNEHFSVLDVGCGRGILGYMLRAYVGESMTLEGVEPNTPTFLNSFVRKIYDTHYDVNITDYLSNIELKYTVVVANHVLEHLPKPEAITTIEQLKDRGRTLILGFPNPRRGFIYNIDDNGPHTHKWGVSDLLMKRLKFNRVRIKNNMVYTWTDKS